MSTDSKTELTTAIYDAIAAFNAVACWGTLQHARNRQYLAEHLAGALSAAGWEPGEAALVAEVRRLRARVTDLEAERIELNSMIRSSNEAAATARARVAELEQTPAIAALEQAFVAEVNDDRALTMLDALIVLRSKLPCTCARSQGLHETDCRRYVPGHDLLSPARRLARARKALRPAADSNDPITAAAAETCAKCRQPFDPADTRFDGHARYYLTGYCRRCVDLCHDNETADHRCVICQ
ncbi:hypothetical protein [Streptomyces sp. NPDC001221]